MPFEQAKKTLNQSMTNLRCQEVAEILGSLGFKVRAGSKGGHKIFYHPAIKGFIGSNYNCGHGRDPIVLPKYVRKIIRVLDDYESDIRGYLKEKKNV